MRSLKKKKPHTKTEASNCLFRIKKSKILFLSLAPSNQAMPALESNLHFYITMYYMYVGR